MVIERNKKSGFVVFYRSEMEWDWYKKPLTAHLFHHCVLKANHEDKMYKGQIIKRGSFVTSYNILSHETGLSVQQTRTALDNLILTHNITKIATRKGTIISVENYDEYQSVTNKSHASQHISQQEKAQLNNIKITTNNNINNNNNVCGAVLDHSPTPKTHDLHFLEFWNVYLKKGYKKDTFEYWKTLEIDDEMFKDILYGAKKYSKLYEKDKTHMVYPRTFLKNEMWKDYTKDRMEEEKRKTNSQEYEAYLREIGAIK